MIRRPPRSTLFPYTTLFRSPVQANRGASLEVARGEIHALVGENGAGKSTLMRVLAGMYQPNGGRVVGDGREVTGWNTGEAIAAAGRMFNLLFNLTPPPSRAHSIFLVRDNTPRG